MEFIYKLLYGVSTIGATVLLIDMSLYFLLSKGVIRKTAAALFLVPTAVIAFSAFNHLVN